MPTPTDDLTKLPFNFNTTLYQPENAYWMAIFSDYVYLKIGDRTGDQKDFNPDINTILSQLKELDPKFEGVEGFNAKSSQGIIIQHEDYVVAAFRGTDELVDWLDNIKVSYRKKRTKSRYFLVASFC